MSEIVGDKDTGVNVTEETGSSKNNAGLDSSVGTVDYWETDRVIKDVPIPKRFLADFNDVYTNGKPNMEFLKDFFFNEGKLKIEVAKKIISDVSEIFRAEPNLIKINTNVTICGDIHGQFYDLLRLLKIGGPPESTHYLFLGDYVDRGSFSIECLFLLYCYKISYPTTFFMLRGNHECRHLTEYFTFKNECKAKYSVDIYNLFCDSFDTLPISALVNNQFLCIHGGLSPEILTIDDFQKIDRFHEPPCSGPLCDILWSDPCENFGSETSDDNFLYNSVRGCSFYFTYSACSEFVERNKLVSVIRAHEAQDAGYKMYRNGRSTNFPVLITIFSAPNYLDVYNNRAAIIKYQSNIANIRQFSASPHPYWLPNFMDVFSWSVPFVGEKITEMLAHVLNVCKPEDFDNISDADKADPSISTTRREIIKNKIRAVGRISQAFSLLRQESLSVVKLKGLTPSGSIPRKIPSNGDDAILEDIEKADKMSDDGATSFDEARELDLANERWPVNPAIGEIP